MVTVTRCQELPHAGTEAVDVAVDIEGQALDTRQGEVVVLRTASIIVAIA